MDKALPLRPTALLLGLSALLLLFRLGAMPLVGPDEPRYARVAVELSRSGDLVTPTLEGRPWMEKPILYYWLAGGAFRLMGETETAARLPAALAGLGMIATTALVGARLFGGAVGLGAGFVLATALLPFAYSRAASMDMLLAASVTGAIGLGALHVHGIAGGASRTAALALVGVALLAKGPLGLVLPALVLGLVVAFETRAPFFRTTLHGLLRLVSPAAILALVLVAAPWYLAILAAQGTTFVEVFFLNHNLARFTSTIHNHPGPFLYYVPVLLLGLFPWSGLVPSALAALRPRESSGDRLLLVWLGAPLLLFSLAGSKLPGYILPCLPPLALMIGRLAAGNGSGARRVVRWTGAALTLLPTLAVCALPLGLALRGDVAWASTLSLAVWTALFGTLATVQIASKRGNVQRTLLVGGAGMLLLTSIVAPPIVARYESGRDLFLPARGREVLAFGAWRTAWMAGYFYNDARVQTVENVGEIASSLTRSDPALVLAGPAEARSLARIPFWSTTELARGPRSHVLLEITVR